MGEIKTKSRKPGVLHLVVVVGLGAVVVARMGRISSKDAHKKGLSQAEGARRTQLGWGESSVKGDVAKGVRDKTETCKCLTGSAARLGLGLGLGLWG